MRKTLVVDDDRALAATLARALGKCGCDCVVAHDVGSARAAASSNPFALAVVDIELPDGSGLDLVHTLRSGPGRPVVVVITGRHDHDATVEAFQRGALDCMTKPLDLDELFTLLQRIFHLRDARSFRRIAAAGGPLWPGQLLVAKSLEMRQILRDIARSARSTAPVLVVGEAGVGKEIVARAIHDASASIGDFLALRCAGLGHASFSSKVVGPAVVYFDEVANLSLPAQSALLRSLHDSCAAEAGSNGGTARVIAATSRRLEVEAAQGRFSQELAQRLQATRIRVPPLRDRTADFSALLDRMLASAARKYRLRGIEIDRDAERTLQLHDWPGNLRELADAVERLLAAGHERITADAVRSLAHADAATPTY